MKNSTDADSRPRSFDNVFNSNFVFSRASQPLREPFRWNLPVEESKEETELQETKEADDSDSEVNLSSEEVSENDETEVAADTDGLDSTLAVSSTGLQEQADLTSVTSTQVPIDYHTSETTAQTTLLDGVGQNTNNDVPLNLPAQNSVSEGILDIYFLIEYFLLKR